VIEALMVVCERLDYMAALAEPPSIQPDEPAISLPHEDIAEQLTHALDASRAAVQPVAATPYRPAPKATGGVEL